VHWPHPRKRSTPSAHVTSHAHTSTSPRAPVRAWESWRGHPPGIRSRKGRILNTDSDQSWRLGLQRWPQEGKPLDTHRRQYIDPYPQLLRGTKHGRLFVRPSGCPERTRERMEELAQFLASALPNSGYRRYVAPVHGYPCRLRGPCSCHEAFSWFDVFHSPSDPRVDSSPAVMDARVRSIDARDPLPCLSEYYTSPSCRKRTRGAALNKPASRLVTTACRVPASSVDVPKMDSPFQPLHLILQSSPQTSGRVGFEHIACEGCPSCSWSTIYFALAGAGVFISGLGTS